MTIRIPAGAAEAEVRVRGSRFIARAVPASEPTAALEARESERRRFHDATHHVYAVRTRASEERFDDDGEPAGTAGRPILASIHRSGVVDVAVVVTRYFGGIKLGTGGLGRAYALAAERALEALPTRRARVARRVTVAYAYEDTGNVARSVDAAGAVREGERYGSRVELDVVIAADRVEWFRAELRNATAGRAEVREGSEETLLHIDT